MALDMAIEHSTKNALEARACVRAQFLFADDVFGPAKVLQLFAAIGRLPEEFSLRRGEDENTWIVTLTIERCPRAERVLAKINSMPALLASDLVGGAGDLKTTGGSQFN
jgi:hypothetical protein